MTRDDKRDLVMIGASLLGVAVGGILDDLRSDAKPASDPSADPAGSRAGVPIATDAAGVTAPEPATVARSLPLVNAPALLTAATLSRRIGEQAGLAPDRLWLNALVAFGVGACLTYFADSVARFLPGLRTRG